MKKILILTLFFIFIFIPKDVFAQEKIDSFNTKITASQNGDMTIEENIIYDFGLSDRHGIFRYIPLVSQIGDLYRVIDVQFLEVKRDGKNEKYQVDHQSDQTEVKIGDKDKTISGPHLYQIKYQVKNGIGSNYSDHDEIYWNITGEGWQVPISSVSATITTDFNLTPNQTRCFTGSPGSTLEYCQIESLPNAKKITTTRTLEPYEGLTIVTSFPVNTFPDSVLQTSSPVFDPDFISFLKVLIPIYFILNIILAPILIFWYHKNKPKNNLGKVGVNFDLPEYPKGKRIAPAESGTIDNAKLDKDDITATIVDLAIRKYLKIEQVKTKGKFLRFGSSEDYKLIKIKEDDNLNNFEKSLLSKIFDNKKEILTKDIKLTFTDFSSLEEQNFKSLVQRGFYSKNPKTQMSTLLTLGIILTVSLNLILGPTLIWLSRVLNGRTKLGDQIDHNTDGLKIFLKNMNRHYKWQAENFFFVEKMIPYAIALGFIDQYMEQLKILKPDYKPTWYSGSGNFYTHYPIFNSAFSSHVTTTAPSSSSGFSGSSGGGGGGGGGGSW